MKIKKEFVIFSAIVCLGIICGIRTAAVAEDLPELPEGYIGTEELHRSMEEYPDEQDAFLKFVEQNPDYECIRVIEDEEVEFHYVTEFTLKEATCYEEGYRNWVCGICGQQGTDTFDIKGHRYEDGKCIWCGRIQTEEEKTVSQKIREKLEIRSEEPGEAQQEDMEFMEEKVKSLFIMSDDELMKNLAGTSLEELEQIKVYVLDCGIPGATEGERQTFLEMVETAIASEPEE